MPPVYPEEVFHSACGIWEESPAPEISWINSIADIYHMTMKYHCLRSDSCTFCALLKEMCDAMTPLPDRFKIKVERYKHKKADRSGSWLITGVRPVDGNSFFELCSPDDYEYRDLSLGGLNDSIRVYPSISGDTSSQKAMTWAKSCLTECEKTHKRCRQFDGHALPIRVLDIRGIDAMSPATGIVKVLETHQIIERYASLSYCWGGDQPIKLLRSNLAQFCQDGISWLELPKTIQEAILATRQLGIHLLWVDSLCIIQDPGDPDKTIQIGQMGLIFRRSQVVLANMKSSSVTEGCYTKASLGIRLKTQPFFMREGVQHLDDRYLHTQTRKDLYPLSTRAWAFQETALAPRVLCFGAKELSWRCHEHSECECGSSRRKWPGKKVASNELVPFKHPLPKSLRDMIFYPSMEKHAQNAYWIMWKESLRNYVSRDLTFGGDRNVGILGLVEQIRCPFLGEYRAGLWSNHVHELLLWYTWPPVPRPETQWPSWSWLSTCFAEGRKLDFATFFQPLKERCNVRLLVPDERPLSPNSIFMQPIRAELTCTLLQGYWEEHDHGPQLWLKTESRSFQSRGQDPKDMPYELFDSEVYRDLPAHRIGADSREAVYCALIGFYDGRGYFLVLKCLNEAESIYERIGICFDYFSGSDRILDRLFPSASRYAKRRGLHSTRKKIFIV